MLRWLPALAYSDRLKRLVLEDVPATEFVAAVESGRSVPRDPDRYFRFEIQIVLASLVRSNEYLYYVACVEPAKRCRGFGELRSTIGPVCLGAMASRRRRF